MATPEKSDVEAQTPADMTMYVVEVEDYHTYVTFAEKAEQAADKVGITGQRALSTEPVEFSHEIANKMIHKLRALAKSRGEKIEDA
jgi:hypothetical protein